MRPLRTAADIAAAETADFPHRRRNTAPMRALRTQNAGTQTAPSHGLRIDRLRPENPAWPDRGVPVRGGRILSALARR